MSGNTHIELAIYYCVDDLPGAHIPATRIITILERFQQGRPLTSLALTYLESQGLLALHRHISDGSTVDEFRKAAKAEQVLRKQDAEAVRLAEIAERAEKEAARQAQIKLAQEKANAARQALERDPKYIAKIKNQKLRASYDLNFFIEQHLFATLMDILRRVDVGKRLAEKDLLWLSTDGDEYYSEKLKSTYHSNEAEFYASEFVKNQDPWMAINASSHYRKCNKAGIADKLLNTIDIEKKKSPKIKSAFFTTHGGVKRDLGQKDEALRLGEKAHHLMNKDFRPCTLLGAVYMETGQYDLGQEWYAKAVERGASERAVDSDLRSIFMRADKTTQVEMRAHLLKVDPERYRWVEKIRR
jgi:Flp pilus assembly protein TadD